MGGLPSHFRFRFHFRFRISLILSSLREGKKKVSGLAFGNKHEEHNKKGYALEPP